VSRKGLDSTFVHFGIRKEDMQIISTLCEKHGVDFDWLQNDILKNYHNRKLKNDELDENSLQKLIEKALQKVK
jgi:hypothetical protein